MISDNDKAKIVKYIQDHKKKSSSEIKLEPNNGGGCGSFVESVIRNATNKEIVNADKIFCGNTDLRTISDISIKAVTNYSELQSLSPSDILCIICAATGFMRHYVLYLENQSSSGCYVVGVNGFVDYQKLNRNYCVEGKFIQTCILESDFDSTGNFIYDEGDRRSPACSQLINIDFTLI